MLNRIFVERLNKELDTMGLPTLEDERAEALARLLKISKLKAENILEGHIPDPILLQKLAEELEVHENWLLGK